MTLSGSAMKRALRLRNTSGNTGADVRIPVCPAYLTILREYHEAMNDADALKAVVSILADTGQNLYVEQRRSELRQVRAHMLGAKLLLMRHRRKHCGDCDQRQGRN